MSARRPAGHDSPYRDFTRALHLQNRVLLKDGDTLEIEGGAKGRLTGKRALITGTGGGQGEAAQIIFCAEGGHGLQL